MVPADGGRVAHVAPDGGSRTSMSRRGIRHSVRPGRAMPSRSVPKAARGYVASFRTRSPFCPVAGKSSTCSASSGGSSSTTWALLPPKPKALTPASRGWPASGQGSSFCTTRSGRRSKGMSGLGVWKCRLGGSWPMLQRQGGLHQAGDPRGRLHVADVGLHRADRAAAARRPPLAEHVPQGQGLDGVAQAACRCLAFRRTAPAPARPSPARRPRAGPAPGRRGWGRSGRCWRRSG